LKFEIYRNPPIGLLDKDGAKELKPLLQKDIFTTDDLIRKNRLSQLVKTLDAYITGKINLMMEPYVPIPSNTT
jgi:hypothetical protein